MNLAHNYEEVYEENQKQRYIEFLSSLSSSSAFNGDTWVCDKRNRSKGNEIHQISIYFSNVPAEYKVMMKFYALMRALDGIGIGRIKGNVRNISSFLKFIDDIQLTEVNILTASRFKEHLDSKNYAESTKSAYWTSLNMFFRKMNGFDGLELRNPFYKNIFQYDRLIDSKYIPEKVADKLDITFMKEEIPITIRCIYWVLRLIPSRISEVLGMDIDCVKPFDGHFCIFIPTWKQNGGYLEPIMKVIHIEDEGIAGHLLSLIKEQQKVALSCKEFLPENKQNALFAYQPQMKIRGEIYFQNRYIVATWATVDYHLKHICEKHNIKDENGEIYQVSSHQFRHNGVTDRLRAGFTLPQIAEMTAHHGTAMLYGSYVHLNLFPETLTEPIKYDTESENPYVLFGGRILNMDAITESRLLKNLRSHRIPGGICADVTHCESGMWDCIACKNFIPEKEQLEFFEGQIKAWDDKAEKFKNDKQLNSNFVEIGNNFREIIEKLEK